MFAIYRKELKIYFRTAFGYVMIALLLAFSGIFVTVFNMALSYADFAYSIGTMSMVLILIVPLLTMRSIAEERHTKTDQLLYSLPIRMSDVVLGKFFAMLTVFLVPTLMTALYPLILSSFGSVSLPAAYVSLLGYFLMGAALIALCTLISSLVENQILAAALSIGACLLFYFIKMLAAILPASEIFSFLLCLAGCLLIGVLVWRMTKSPLVGGVGAMILAIPTAVIYGIKPEWFLQLVPNFLTNVSPFSRLTGFSYGYLDVGGIVFYLSFATVCLFLTVQSMEMRRKG